MIPLAAGGGRWLVAFARLGDTVSLTPARTRRFHWTGPMAEPDVIALRDAAEAHLSAAPGVFDVTIDKWVPFDPGLSTAPLRVAHMRSAQRIGLAPNPSEELEMSCARRGQASCLDLLEQSLGPALTLPPLHVVLIETGAAFEEPQETPAEALGDLPTDIANAEDMALWLEAQPTTDPRPWPGIAEAIDELRLAPGCLHARVIPGSALSLGLFPDAATAQGAAGHLSHLHPAWWVAQTVLS